MTAAGRGPASAGIPFNRAVVEGAELDYIGRALRDGHTASSGPFTAAAAAVLSREVGAAEVLLTTSCTSALELAALMLDINPGDTVVVPSFSFVSSATAFVRAGARVLFCDIEPRNLGLDPAHLATLLDDSVRAVVVVHYAGIACDLDGIRAVLAGHPDVALIEDNAHGLFGRYRGQPLGSFGRFGALSFHETKNIVCGEGGALLVNDPADRDRARIVYDKGTDRQAFLLGQVDKYSWRDIGSSFGLAEPLAAYLLAQLERAPHIQARRHALCETYDRALRPHAQALGYQVPHIRDGCEPAYHLYYLLMPDQPSRDTVLRSMRASGINPTFHYVPLHTSEAGRMFAARPTHCPVTEDISSRLLRLPLYNSLTEAEADHVAEAFLRAAGRVGRSGSTS